MALVKYGGGIIQQSGSMGGSTYARNRFGNYVRARTKPVNPKSSRQSAARIIMMYLAEAWRESPMTDAIRANWETYAQSVSWLNKLGEAVTLTGFNMFMRSNAALLGCGGAIVTAAPTDLGLPAADPTFSVAGSEAAQLLAITFDDTATWCDLALAHMVIDMGIPQNPTRNFFGGPWRFSGVLDGSVGSPPTTGDTVAVAWPLVEGQRIWCRASIIQPDGRVTTKFESANFLVTA